MSDLTYDIPAGKGPSLDRILDSFKYYYHESLSVPVIFRAKREGTHDGKPIIIEFDIGGEVWSVQHVTDEWVRIKMSSYLTDGKPAYGIYCEVEYDHKRRKGTLRHIST